MTVDVTFTCIAEIPAPSTLPFSDVRTGDWFYLTVQYAYANGLVSGVGNDQFNPNGITLGA